MLKYESKSLEEVEKILESAQTQNRRYSRQQFEKYFSCNDTTWLVAYDAEQPVAMCVLTQSCPEDYVYVAELQAFKSGHEYGKQLLKHVLEQYSSVWLLKDISAESSLLHYYRSFAELSEFKTLDKRLRRWQHVFSKNCSKDVLRSRLSQ